MERKAAIAVLIAATLAGSSGVFVKHIDMPASSMGFVRSLVPVTAMGLYMLWQKIPFFRGNYRLMLGASALNVIRIFLFFNAFIYTSIAHATLILYTWPIFTTLFSILFLKEQVTRRNILLLVLAFAGIMVVYANQPFSFDNQDFLGMTAALGTAMVYAVTIVIFKHQSGHYSAPEIIFYQNFVGVFAFLPFILINRPLPALVDLEIAAAHAFFLGTLGFSFFFFGLRHLKASTAGLLAYVEIVSALIFSTLWMKEILTWNMGLGGIIIVFTTALLKR